MFRNAKKGCIRLGIGNGDSGRMGGQVRWWNQGYDVQTLGPKEEASVD